MTMDGSPEKEHDHYLSTSCEGEEKRLREEITDLREHIRSLGKCAWACGRDAMEGSDLCKPHTNQRNAEERSQLELSESKLNEMKFVRW